MQYLPSTNQISCQVPFISSSFEQGHNIFIIPNPSNKIIIKMIPSNVSQSAMTALFEQNLAVDEMRETEFKSVWEGLPRQDLHSKLDKIQQNFLREMTKRKERGGRLQNFQGNENLAITRLEQSIKKGTSVPTIYIDAMIDMMDKYRRLKAQNQEKQQKAVRLGKEISELQENQEYLRQQIEEKRLQQEREKKIRDFREYSLIRSYNRIA